jgi:hypothetical protein
MGESGRGGEDNAGRLVERIITLEKLSVRHFRDTRFKLLCHRNAPATRVACKSLTYGGAGGTGSGSGSSPKTVGWCASAEGKLYREVVEEI